MLAEPALVLALDLEAGGYFWEAHEVLEALWLRAVPNSRERHLLQGFIQRANAGLKSAMGAERASRRLWGLAAEHFACARGLTAIDVEGLHKDAVARAAAP
jgi:predicted metal-dependent hydrolase